MYRIGEFAMITGLSVKTLRYYDEINLLKPSKIDKFTSYRYYTNKELEQVRKIEYLKQLSFSLIEIKTYLKTSDISKLKSKRKELQIKRDLITGQIQELDTLIINLDDRPKIYEKQQKC